MSFGRPGEVRECASESARVLACAPLIFFFYSYGRRAAVPEGVDVARTLYWYAVTANRKAFDAGPGLTRLLVSWGFGDVAGNATTDVTGVLRTARVGRVAQIKVQVTWRESACAEVCCSPAKSPALCPSHRTRCDRRRCRIAGAWARCVRRYAFVGAEQRSVLAERAAAVGGQLPVGGCAAAPYTPAVSEPDRAARAEQPGDAGAVGQRLCSVAAMMDPIRRVTTSAR